MNYLKLDEPIPYQGSFVNAVRIDFVGKLTLDMVEPQFTLGIANFDEAGELTGFLEVAGHTPRISGGPFDKRRGALLMAVIKDIFGALEITRTTSPPARTKRSNRLWTATQQPKKPTRNWQTGKYPRRWRRSL